MNKVIKKVLIILFLIILLTEFSMSSLGRNIIVSNSFVSYAADPNDDIKNAVSTIIDTIGNLVEGIVGILTYSYRLLPLSIGIMMQTVGNSIASVADNRNKYRAIYSCQYIF